MTPDAMHRTVALGLVGVALALPLGATLEGLTPRRTCCRKPAASAAVYRDASGFFLGATPGETDQIGVVEWWDHRSSRGWPVFASVRAETRRFDARMWDDEEPTSAQVESLRRKLAERVEFVERRPEVARRILGSQRRSYGPSLLGMFGNGGLFSIPGALLFARVFRRTPQPRIDECANCRYSLAGLTSLLCPECGQAIPEREPPGPIL